MTCTVHSEVCPLSCRVSCHYVVESNKIPNAILSIGQYLLYVVYECRGRLRPFIYRFIKCNIDYKFRIN
jgi:hypothetical protein